MRWFAISVLATISLFAQAASLDALPVETQQKDCGSARPARVELRADSIAIRQLDPDHRYVVKLKEHGVDLSLAADHSDGAGNRWVNSDPMGYATETRLLRSNAQGEATIGLRVGKLLPWARLSVVIYCKLNEGDASTAALLSRAEIGEFMASAVSSGDRLDALRVLPLAGLTFWRSDKPSEDRMWVQFQLAQLASWGGLGEIGEAWLRLARDEAVQMGDPVSEAWASGEIAGELLSRSDARGDAEYLRTIEMADRLGLEDISAFAANGQCIYLRVAGDSESAAECYLRTIKRFSEMGYESAEASARISRATALLFLGRYQEAVAELDQAGVLANRNTDELGLARTWLIRAQVARWNGDFERALSLLGQALALHKRLGRTDDIARAERQIAQTYELAQEPLRAEHFFLASLASAEQRGDQASVDDIRVMLAKLDAAQGNYESALALLASATASLASGKDSHNYTFGMLQMAAIQRDAGQPQAARATLRRLMDSSHTLQWRYQVRLDALRLELGDAAPDFDAESALAPAAEQALGKGDLTLFLDLANALLADRIRRDDQPSMLALARRAVNEGVRVAARVQSPALRNALLTKLKHFAAAPLWVLESGAIAEATALKSLSNLEALRSIEQQPMPVSGGSNDTLVELERLLAEADSGKQAGSPQRERLVLQLTSQDAKVRAHEAFPREDVQDEAMVAPLPASVGALLYLVIDGSRAGAMTFDTRGWRWRGDLDAATIRDSTHGLQKLLQSGYASRDLIDTEVSQLVAGLRWSELFDVAPAQLSIVLDSSLTALPWALLPAPSRSDIQLAASTQLVMLQSLRATPQQPFSSLQLGAAWASSGSGLPTLTAAEKELQRVGAQWPALPQLSHALVSREKLEEALSTDGALVHLAAHGRGDEGRVEDAGLWLADEGGKPTFVSALRLRRMSVAAELVVLGACESGASESGRSLGVGGVGGSLVDAGAAAVVATRWPVSDRAALAFAEAFHRALTANPRSPEAALQSALLELRGMAFARHPTHWAGWFLLRSGPRLGSDSARN